MIGRACIPMRSASAIVAGVTSVSKGQTPTHLAFLIGYMDSSQTVLPIFGRDDMQRPSGVKRTRRDERDDIGQGKVER